MGTEMAARLDLLHGTGLQQCFPAAGRREISSFPARKVGRSCSCGSEQAPAGNNRSCRREGARSQSDFVGESTRANQPASFWDRLHEAWRVLIGIPSEAQATKQRFSKVLVRDRGFNSANLARLYNTAKGALKQHVELENDDDSRVTAFVDRLGELRLDFRVKRVKSVLLDEPYSDLDVDTDGRLVWDDQTRVVHEVEKSVSNTESEEWFYFSETDMKLELETEKACQEKLV